MAEENPFARLFNKPSSIVSLGVLKAGSGDEGIHVGITNTDPAVNAYDCISYDRSHGLQDVVTIEVAGEPMAIPRTLETALRGLRKPDASRILWADLLAGSSVEQRSSQAAIVKTVISNANQVIVWLGPEREHSAIAFDVLQNLANRWRQARLHSGFPSHFARATRQQMIGLQRHIFSKNMDDLQGSNKAVWKVVQELLTSTYFESVQSIPEVLLARKTVVACGKSTIDWDDFVGAGNAAMMVMGQHFKMEFREGFAESLALISSLNIAHTRKSEGDTLELLPMIQSARDCSVPDPREVVFSMLPIINPSRRQTDTAKKEPPPVADYSKSEQEVFTDAARYVIHERQDLMIWWNESPPRRRKIKSLPSWVPDWTSALPSGTVSVAPDASNGMREWFEHLNPALRKRIKVSGNSLHVQAHVLDRVDQVSDTFTDENCRRLCLTWFQRTLTLPNESADAKYERLFRTLVLNQQGFGASLKDKAAPPSTMRNSFRSLIAEERILDLLNCTTADLLARPDIVQRARTDPQIAALGQMTGHSQAFEALLRQNSLGRSFYTTKTGRTGMTAVQTLPPGRGEESPVPDFDAAMGDPLGPLMLEMFQAHVREHQPHAAGALASALAGNLPGQTPPGVRSGDLVVALVGGFQPYILRSSSLHASGGSASAQPDLDGSKYRYVGDCYLHGVMNGEPFKDSSGSFRNEIKLEDIEIV